MLRGLTRGTYFLSVATQFCNETGPADVRIIAVTERAPRNGPVVNGCNSARRSQPLLAGPIASPSGIKASLRNLSPAAARTSDAN